MTIILQPDEIRIPGDIRTLDAFRRWCHSDEFPEKGRIDWIDGHMEIDMSPEDLNTHGSAKVAIASALVDIVERSDRGAVYVDSTRITAPGADVSTEPDVVAVLFDSIDAGRARLVPKAGGAPGRYVEIEGTVDLIVECVSGSSVTKDRKRLRARYHSAGVPEYWLVDARPAEPIFTVLRHAPDDYVEVAADPDGFTPSAVLGLAVRLVRLPPRSGIVRYRLESR